MYISHCPVHPSIWTECCPVAPHTHPNQEAQSLTSLLSYCMLSIWLTLLFLAQSNFKWLYLPDCFCWCWLVNLQLEQQCFSGLCNFSNIRMRRKFNFVGELCTEIYKSSISGMSGKVSLLAWEDFLISSSFFLLKSREMGAPASLRSMRPSSYQWWDWQSLVLRPGRALVAEPKFMSPRDNS